MGNRYLDEQIAKKFFRWIVFWKTEEGGDVPYILYKNSGTSVPVPHFSSNLEEAYRIVDIFQKNNFSLITDSTPGKNGNTVWKAGFYQNTKNRDIPLSQAETLSEAICHAALKRIE